jgi:hypothetical protein
MQLMQSSEMIMQRMNRLWALPIVSQAFTSSRIRGEREADLDLYLYRSLKINGQIIQNASLNKGAASAGTSYLFSIQIVVAYACAFHLHPERSRLPPRETIWFQMGLHTKCEMFM